MTIIMQKCSNSKEYHVTDKNINVGSNSKD
jgi:hypothetical protein